MIESIYFSDTGNVDDLVAFIARHPEQLRAPEYGIAGGRTLLHIAAAYGDVRLCDRLVHLGISVNAIAPSIGNGLPISEAASRGHIDAVIWFLENGSQVDGPIDSVTTPLMNAVVSGHKQVVDVLLSAGADANRLHLKYNQTPLDLALIWKQSDIAGQLIAAGGKKAIEPINLTDETGAGIIEHIYNKVGPILSTQLHPESSPASNFSLHDLQLRVALINEEKSCKLLFSMGVHEQIPRQELMICLSSDWPVHKKCLEVDTFHSFPVRMMFLIAQRRLSGAVLKEGDVFDRSSTSHTSLVWPTEIDALVAVDYQFEHVNRERQADEEVMLLMLVPVKHPKSGRSTEKKNRTWLEKQRLASWKKIALRVP